MTDSATTLDRAHPISVALSGFEEDLKALRDQPAWAMSPEETRKAMAAAARLEAQLVELQTRIAAHGHTLQVESDAGATSTANWWAHRTRMTRALAHRRMKLGRALAKGLHEPVRVALADGELLVDQAEVIIDAIQALPDTIDPEIVASAQAHLLEKAGEFDARALRVIGRRILEVVAPEVGEAHEADLLAKEERDAAAKARLWMREDGHGKTHGRFTVPTYIGDMLRKYLLALAAPRHRTAVDGQAPTRGMPSDHRMGEAFCEFIERYPADRAPTAGGVEATVVVTLSYETLLGGLKAAQLDTGTRISPGLSRRLACEAGVIPAVLGGKSEVLDLGRRCRFFTRAQRIALWIRQGGCTAEGCDWPPGMCHAHHDTPWSAGGSTDLDSGRLLCPRHHARAHDPIYDMRRLPNGKVRFHRRT